jgi:hypothetical protein
MTSLFRVLVSSIVVLATYYFLPSVTVPRCTDGGQGGPAYGSGCGSAKKDASSYGSASALPWHGKNASITSIFGIAVAGAKRYSLPQK